MRKTELNRFKKLFEDFGLQVPSEKIEREYGQLSRSETEGQIKILTLALIERRRLLLGLPTFYEIAVGKGQTMTDEDVQAFIRHVGEHGETWSAEKVKEMYGNCSLIDALAVWFNERALPACREALNRVLAD